MLNTQTSRRRASANVSVPFLVALAASALTSACSDDPSDSADQANTADTAVVDTFTSAADCVASNRYDQTTCDGFEATAKADYQASVPRYATKEECQKDSDQCDPTQTPPANGGASGSFDPPHGGGGSTFFFYNGGGGYSPTYSGFSVARPAPGASNPPVARSVYRTPGNGFATFSGVEGLKSGEAMTAPRATFGQSFRGSASFSEAAPHAPPVSARGGFGSSARGGFGFGE